MAYLDRILRTKSTMLHLCLSLIRTETPRLAMNVITGDYFVYHRQEMKWTSYPMMSTQFCGPMNAWGNSSTNYLESLYVFLEALQAATTIDLNVDEDWARRLWCLQEPSNRWPMIIFITWFHEDLVLTTWTITWTTRTKLVSATRDQSVAGPSNQSEHCLLELY